MKIIMIIWRQTKIGYKSDLNDYKSDSNYSNSNKMVHQTKTASDDDVCKMRSVSRFWMNEARSRGLNCSN